MDHRESLETTTEEYIWYFIEYKSSILHKMYSV